MKYVLLFVALAVVVLSTGCAMPGYAQVRPPQAGILTEWKAPLSADNRGDVTASKVGRATVEQMLWIISQGDCSIETAAKNAGITNVKYVDYEIFDVLFGAYSKFTIVVHGD